MFYVSSSLQVYYTIKGIFLQYFYFNLFDFLLLIILYTSVFVIDYIYIAVLVCWVVSGVYWIGLLIEYIC